MKQKLLRFGEYIKTKTLEEKKNLHDCKKEVERKNTDILQTMLFSVTLILGASFFISFISDFFTSAGVSNLRWAYLVISLLAFFTFLYIRVSKSKNIIFMIYLVNSGAFFYSFIVSAVVAPEQISVTFLIVLFMMSTLYLDYGWRIHLFMLLATLAFIWGISFYKAPVPFNSEAMNAFVVLALLLIIGTIVRSARLGIFVARHTLHRYAYYDQLTGVHNRRKLFEDFAKYESPQEKRRITALAILDIDFFKRYNDTYGHSEGDRCLENIGACLLSAEKEHTLRSYRYGGEEFVVAFIDSTKEQVNATVTSLLASVRDLKIEHKGSEHQVVSVSIGVAHLNETQTPKFEAALSTADAALYEAKANGRNKAVFTDFSADKPLPQLASLRKR